MKRRECLVELAVAALAASGCASTSSDGRIEVPFWFCTFGGDVRKVLLSLVDRFHAQQSKVVIKPVFQGDYFEGLAKLRTGFAAHSVPALIHVVGEVLPYLAEAGVLEPLDAFGAGDLDLVPELSQQGTFKRSADRPLYALPFNRSTPIVYYNGRIFAELGLSAPSTWDELREAARKATDRSGDRVKRWGFECPIDWWFWIALVGQAGGEVVGDDGELTLGGDAGARAIELWQTLMNEDRTMKPPVGRDYQSWSQTNQDFLSGQVAMVWTSSAYLKTLEAGASFPVVAAPLPKLERRAVPTGGSFFVIPRRGRRPQQEAAFAFLAWMAESAQVETWSISTGYIPTSRGTITNLERRGFYRDHPNHRVALDQLPDAMPWPWAPNLFRVQREAVQPRLEDAVLSNKDARRTLEEARAAAREP